jgi:homoserine kinase
MKKKKVVRIRVPATTANVGPGFDSLGIALNLYNFVELKTRSIPEISLSGKDLPSNTHGAIKMVMNAARKFFNVVGEDEFGFDAKLITNVPIARGLGSSVTVRLGITMGLNELLGRPLDREELVTLVSDLEGHPDNAAPAALGGFVVSGKVQDKVSWMRTKVSSKLKFVTAIPSFEVETKKARAILPSKIPFEDAVHNVNRSALLVAALWDENYEAIGDFLEDRLHQPCRSSLIPQLFPALNAAKLAGAIGGWLSGSGSTVMAVTLSNPKKVGEAMKKVFEKSGVGCDVLVLTVDNQGATLAGS